MVFTVTKDDIRVRMRAVDGEFWPLPSVTEKLTTDPRDRVGFTKWRVVFEDVLETYGRQANQEFATCVDAPKQPSY